MLTSPLGVDFGKARIGLATCPGGFISTPLKILDTKRRLWLELAEEIIGIAQQQGASAPAAHMQTEASGLKPIDTLQGQPAAPQTHKVCFFFPITSDLCLGSLVILRRNFSLLGSYTLHMHDNMCHLSI